MMENITEEKLLGQVNSPVSSDTAPLRTKIPVRPDGVDQHIVEDLLLRYPEEWRLWEQVAENFQNPNYHSAYLSLATRTKMLETAAQRYGKHQKITAPVEDMQADAAVAELMLTRVQHLVTMQIEYQPHHEQMENSRLYYRLKLLVFFVLGLILAFIILGKLFIKPAQASEKNSGAYVYCEKLNELIENERAKGDKSDVACQVATFGKDRATPERLLQQCAQLYKLFGNEKNPQEIQCQSDGESTLAGCLKTPPEQYLGSSKKAVLSRLNGEITTLLNKMKVGYRLLLQPKGIYTTGCKGKERELEAVRMEWEENLMKWEGASAKYAKLQTEITVAEKNRDRQFARGPSGKGEAKVHKVSAKQAEGAAVTGGQKSADN